MKSLCTNTMEDRNKINPLYWRHVCKTKWIKVSSRSPTPVDIDVFKYWTQTIKFPNRVLNVETDTPGTTNDSIYTNLSRKLGVWCIISNSGTVGAAELTIRRTIRFRDEHGSAN